MKKKLSSFYCVLFLFCIGFTLQGSAQNKVAYTYDMAGNRLTRKLVILSNPNYVKKSADEPAPVKDQLGERKITIYPNPTKGNLAVEIIGGDDKEKMNIILFNAQGKQLCVKKTNAVTTLLDLTNYPAGYYLLRIQANDKMTEFKILKE